MGSTTTGTTKLTLLILGVFFGAPLAAGLACCGGAMGLGLAIEARVIPDSEAIPGHQLPDQVASFVRASGWVEPGDEILYFYCDAMFDWEANGHLVTEERVVSYWTQGDDLRHLVVDLDQITEIDAHFSDTIFDNSAAWISTADGRQFQLLVGSPGEGHDRAFVKTLRAQWRSVVD